MGEYNKNVERFQQQITDSIFNVAKKAGFNELSEAGKKEVGEFIKGMTGN